MSALCVAPTPFPIICSFASLVSLIISVPIILYGVYQSVSHRTLKQMRPFLIIYYMTCLLWLVGMSGYNTFQLTLYSCTWSNYFDFIRLFTRMCGFFGYSYSLIAVYLLFLLRLKYHFIGTQFALSVCAFYGLLSGAFIQGILNGVAAYYFFQDTKQWHIALMCQYASIITYTMYSIALLILFLRNIARSLTNNDIQDVNSSSELLAKYMILASLAFLTSILANLMCFYRAFIGDPSSINTMLLQLTMLQMDCLITIICLHLQFSYRYSHQFYNRCCCGCFIIYRSLQLNLLHKLNDNMEETNERIIMSSTTSNATSKGSNNAQMSSVTDHEKSMMTAFTNTQTT